MTISWIQAILLGIFASLSSMPGMGGSSIGNYTLGRPLIGGLISGLILGDVTTGIMVGVALQVVYIALVTPGGTVSAMCVPSLTSVFLLLSCLCMLITSQMKLESPQLQLQSVQPLGLSVPFFSTVLQP